ncbi:hypothetical protein N9917_01250 [Deltaproteobacteria bacterium]|nr:hypothetical protein [Deltaproteobacteria bacterium]
MSVAARIAFRQDPARVGRLARRIAFRILVADLSNKGFMDEWIRAKILESAAGMPYNSWSGNPDRGLPEARKHFPNAEDGWFSHKNAGLFGSLASGVMKNMRGYEQHADDVIMDTIGKTKYMTDQGKALASEIERGSGLDQARRHLAKVGASRAKDWRKKKMNQEGKTKSPDESRTRIKNPFKSERDTSSPHLVEIWGDVLMSNRAIKGRLSGLVRKMPDGQAKEILEIWLDSPGKSNAAIGREIGSDRSNPSAYVGQVKGRVLKALLDDRKVIQILELAADRAQAERKEQAKPTRAPSGDPGSFDPGDFPKWAKSIKRVAAAYLTAV